MRDAEWEIAFSQFRTGHNYDFSAIPPFPSEQEADVYRDEVYLQELDRRSRICKGRPLDRAELTWPRPKKWAEMFPEGDVFIRDK